jgi:hypothetical protein
MKHRPPKYRRLVLIACLAATPAFGADFQVFAQLEGLAKSAAVAVLPPPTDRQRLHRCRHRVWAA